MHGVAGFGPFVISLPSISAHCGARHCRWHPRRKALGRRHPLVSARRKRAGRMSSSSRIHVEGSTIIPLGEGTHGCAPPVTLEIGTLILEPRGEVALGGHSRIQIGMMFVNRPTWTAPDLPFGAIKNYALHQHRLRRVGDRRSVDPQRRHDLVAVDRRDRGGTRDHPEPSARARARALWHVGSLHPLGDTR